MADKKKKSKQDDFDNNQMYKELKSKEMLSKVEEKIESNDPQLLKAIKNMLQDDGDKKPKLPPNMLQSKD